jgi:cell division protein FtsN
MKYPHERIMKMLYICGSKQKDWAVNDTKNKCYRIQLGSFRNYNNAMELQLSMLFQGIKSDIIQNDGLYHVRTECIANLDEAVFYEHYLKHKGFDTMITIN